MTDEAGGRTNGKPDIVEKVRKCLAEAADHDRDNRRDAADDLQFLAGNQWPDQVRREREQDGRPLLVVNRLPQFVRQVSNDIRQADISIKVTPSDGALLRAEQVQDPVRDLQQDGQQGMPPGMGPEPPQQSLKKPTTMADVMNGILREIQYQSSASHVYATAAEQQVACGIGGFRIVTEYADEMSFDQVIRIKAINNPMTVFWDPASTEVDRSDAEWVIVTEMIPRETFKQRYPKASQSSVEVYDEPQGELYWTTSDKIRIAEFWCKKPVKRRIVQLQNGQVVDADEAPEGTPIIAQREVNTHRIEQYIVSGQEVLEGPSAWAGKYLPIIAVLGSEIPLEEKTIRHGLIRYAKDSQQLYNYARSSAAEVMGQAPKSPWLVTTKMIGPFKAVWDMAARRSLPYLPYAHDQDVPAGPQRQPPPDVPTAYVQEAAVADGDIKATVGIYDPQLGQRSTETSGRAIMAREQQGDTGTFHYSDNLRRALEHAGRALVDLIPRIYDSDRVVRILGEDDAELYVPINRVVSDNGIQGRVMNDITAGKYDCRVKIGPSYATKRMEAADSIMNFVQAVPQTAPLVGDLIATNMDWPGADAIAERLKRAVPAEILGEDAPPQEPDPMQQMQIEAMQLEMQQAQLKNAELEAKINKMAADTEKVMAEIDKTEVETEKSALEADLMPIDREREDERHMMDREDRFEEMRMRHQPPAPGNASMGRPPSGESN